MRLRIATLGATVFLAIMAWAPASVAWTRTTRDAPRDETGGVKLSLNAASYLPPSDLEGIEWLRLNAKPNEKVIEAVKVGQTGQIEGDYDGNFGRVAAFSGVTSIVAWPQHVAGWGADWGEALRRSELIRIIPQDPNALPELRKLGATYLFMGAYEPKLPRNPQLQPVWSSGETQILRLVP